jgi:hypothetical protein
MKGTSMEWTDKAKQELKETLDRLRTSLVPQEVDAEEVTADIKARIEEELTLNNGAVVTAEDVRSAALKIGVQEILQNDLPKIKADEEFIAGIEKPRRIRKRMAAGWFWFTGIILPILALGTELTTRICLDSGIVDPLPTPLHALLIALVPLANFLGWRAVSTNKPNQLKPLGFLCGMATSIAAYYTLLFATLTPFALLGFAAVIYFGIGLLSFLPLSPLLSLIATLRMRVLIKRTLLPAGQKAVPLFKKGLLAGLLAALLFSTPMYLTEIGLTMAASDGPDTRLRGIKLLRATGDEVLMNRACYGGDGAPTDPVSWLINRGKAISPDDARDIYYRVFGEAFNTKASPTLGFRNRRNPGGEFDWDPETGGDVVAGRLKGLSLRDSRIDGVMNADAATAYLEWTMVFRNDWQREREARAQVALPPGAVVSRLTLWIDGEEHEAAFGGRSQVKQAYKKVVQRRRDPVLVTTCGPDRVLVQCYPVPANGEMKIRVGITAPLSTSSETERVLRLPRLLERNFRIPENFRHAVWIENTNNPSSALSALHAANGRGLIGDLTDADLNSPSAAIKANSPVSACWTTDGTQTVLQQITASNDRKPDHIVLVIDSSIGMKDHFDTITSALRELPENINLSVFIADDEPIELCRLRPANQQLVFEISRKIRTIEASGGKDNSPALRDALTIPTVGKSTDVLWIHGPQTWELGAADNVRQAMERQSNIRLLDFQIGDGPHRLIEKLDNLANLHTVPRMASEKDDLSALFRSFAANVTVWQAFRTSVTQGTDSAVKTDDHLVRLYALDQIRADLSDNNPGNKKALELALKYHLVTPVSGAVVLETQQQYDDAKLTPTDSSLVPSIPEPGVMALVLFALFLLWIGRRIYQQIALALELR